MKKHFALKLIPPRPSFGQDMTTEERAIMQQHIVYWRDLMDKGFVLVYGPVLDPKGVYGLGIIEAESEEQVNSFMANDPALQINTYEVYPMMAVVPAK
jgi:uncharacterized protein YciI